MNKTIKIGNLLRLKKTVYAWENSYKHIKLQKDNIILITGYEKHDSNLYIPEDVLIHYVFHKQKYHSLFYGDEINDYFEEFI